MTRMRSILGLFGAICALTMLALPAFAAPSASGGSCAATVGTSVMFSRGDSAWMPVITSGAFDQPITCGRAVCTPAVYIAQSGDKLVSATLLLRASNVRLQVTSEPVVAQAQALAPPVTGAPVETLTIARAPWPASGMVDITQFLGHSRRPPSL